jgi:hypothetical protein
VLLEGLRASREALRQQQSAWVEVSAEEASREHQALLGSKEWIFLWRNRSRIYDGDEGWGELSGQDKTAEREVSITTPVIIS